MDGQLPTTSESDSISNVTFSSKNMLLQQALTQAAIARARQQAFKAAGDSVTVESESSHSFIDKMASSNATSVNLKFISEDEIQQNLIKSHPLFPILEKLLLKCEHSTWNLSDKSINVDDIIEMLKQLKENQSNIRSENADVDRLILDAIYTLRANLFELAKVSHLCDDFLTRYLQNVKQKINQYTLLGFAIESDDDSDSADGRFSPITSSNRPRGVVTMFTMAQDTVSVPLSNNVMINNDNNNCKEANHTDRSESHSNWIFTDESLDFDNRGPGRKSSLPKKAVDVLKSWLFKHASHPYPCESEKMRLSHEASLSLIQVNNWFINARRRILYPMLNDGQTNETTQIVSKHKNKKQKLSSPSLSVKESSEEEVKQS